jgi:hypothetical protein
MLARIVFLVLLALPAQVSAQLAPEVHPLVLTNYEWQRYKELKRQRLSYAGPIIQLTIGVFGTVIAASAAANQGCFQRETYKHNDFGNLATCSGLGAGMVIGSVLTGLSIPKLVKRVRMRRELRYLELKGTVEYTYNRINYTFRF